MAKHSLHENPGGRSFTDDELKSLVQALDNDADGVELTDYFPYGIPTPDVVNGRLQVAPGRIGQVIESMSRSKAARFRKIEIFPVGIVRPPESFSIAFQAVPQRDT